ncbi:unnamed protein product [Spirodela intermedia]|uniref:Uncharacterized protein n=1 Tax=Spirodela intermedia TaxID=51605 RepID=A0ABN7ECC2_SPIIN|nr:unnamed protein product [Spirodela intermedia]
MNEETSCPWGPNGRGFGHCDPPGTHID